MRRLEPRMSVDASGNITWLSTIVDYDPSLFFRGKKVTNEEFNELFLQQAYQGNYTADSLSAFLEKHLRPTIHRTFTSTFNLLPSYVKTFTSSDWGELQEDGYYYITITSEEHGFRPDENMSELERMNIDTEVYLMDADGQFFEVTQVETTRDNTVTIYTDDNTVSGFAVIRTNDKAYALAATSIDASQVDGLHPVATSGKYTDLVDIDGPTGPNARIAQNAIDILKIINGNTIVDKARQAESAEYTNALLLGSTIQGIPVSNIFEEGSNYVKDATHANSADIATVAQYADADTSKGTIEARLTALGFKTDSITLTGGTPYITGASNEIGNAVLKRQGNYVLIEFNVLNSNYCWANNQQIGTIPLYDGKPAFFPSSTQVYNIGGRCCFRSGYVLYENLNCSFTLTITTDGKINISNVVWSNHAGTNYKDISGEVYSFKITIGYEANPIT